MFRVVWGLGTGFKFGGSHGDSSENMDNGR